MAGPLETVHSHRSRLGFAHPLAALALILLIVQPTGHCGEGSPKNLLKNPGFEEESNEQPAVWRCFVVPAEGVESLWDKKTYRSGQRSVMLRIEKPYETEVYDNWYQHVPGVQPETKLILSGYIKSEDVTEAAIWLQCWRDSSREVIKFATTSIAHPMSGTVDWTHVETSVVPPPETAFLTVRCIVAGTGAAWFDDLSLIQEQHRSEPPPPEKESNNANADTFKELLEAHKILLETNSKLTEDASKLAQELVMLREELNELRLLIETWLQENVKRPLADSASAAPSPPFRPAGRKMRNNSE